MDHKVISRGKVFVLLIIIVAISIVPMASAATVTLTPTAQAPSASVTVVGTGFGAQMPVGLGFGAEVTVIDEVMATTGPYGVSGGPYHGNTVYLPVKPGTFKMAIQSGSNLINLFSDVAGNGTLDIASAFSALVINATMDYVTGQFTTFWKDPVPEYSQALPHLVNYTRYEYNVTSAAGVTANPSGAFTADITVPSVANGTYIVTAIDASGNLATSSLSVDSTVPEGLTIGVMVLVSSAAVMVGSRYFRKRSKV